MSTSSQLESTRVNSSQELTRVNSSQLVNSSQQLLSQLGQLESTRVKSSQLESIDQLESPTRGRSAQRMRAMCYAAQG